MYRLTICADGKSETHTSEHFYYKLEKAIPDIGVNLVRVSRSQLTNGSIYDVFSVCCELCIIYLEILDSNNQPTVFTPDFFSSLYGFHCLKPYYKSRTRHNKPLIEYCNLIERTYNYARP